VAVHRRRGRLRILGRDLLDHGLVRLRHLLHPRRV
jgi:hypothetical protein